LARRSPHQLHCQATQLWLQKKKAGKSKLEKKGLDVVSVKK